MKIFKNITTIFWRKTNIFIQMSSYLFISILSAKILCVTVALLRNIWKLSFFYSLLFLIGLKLHCDEHFTHAFTACGCVFKEITLFGSNQGNYFENATGCSKRTLKTPVATQLKATFDQTDITKPVLLNFAFICCDL